MAINPDIRDQAYQFFIEEAPELLQILESGLLTLNQDHSTAKIHSLMRAAHTLKGGSASVGLEAIALLAHRLETILRSFYSDEMTIDTDLENQLLQAYDCLRLPLAEQISTGSFDPVHALAIADPIFTQIEARCGEALSSTEAYMPSSSELGVNMVVSIFEVDVAQGLEYLSHVADQADVGKVAEALRSQLDIFAGFAELFSLPDFAEIVKTVQQAWEAHPDRILDITELALIDFECYRQSIVSNQHAQPMQPSQALLDLAHGLETIASNVEIAKPTDALAETTEFVDIDLHLLDTTENPIEITLENEIGAIEEDKFNQIFEENSDSSNEIENNLSETVQHINISLLENLFGVPTALSFTDADDIAALSEELLDDSVEDLVGNLAEDPEEFLEEVDYFDFISESEQLSEPVDDRSLLSIEPDREPHGESGREPDLDILEAPIDILAEEAIAEAFPTNSFNPFLVSDLPTGTSSLVPANLHRDNALSLPEAQTIVPTRSRADADTPHTEPDEPIAPPLTVRVDSDRLERMNRLIGELSINHNSLFLQSDQLQGTLRELLNRFSRFQSLANQLREFSDQTIVASERYRLRSDSPTPAPLPPNALSVPPSTDFSSATVEFDSLEIDSYGLLHAQLQSIIEEVVQLEEAVDDVALYVRQSTQMLNQQRPTLTYLQDEITWARMVPIGEVLNRFPRMLRDLSATYGKPVELKLVGTEVLVDKAILEKLYNPLLHLIRNAFDHGIEPLSVRQHQGKPEQGTIEICTYHRGNQTIIEISDDGQGLNLDRIRGRIFELGWLTPDQLAVTPPARLFDFIFEPGFSTARRVSKLSGRGVGLDVVRSQLKAVKGTVTVETTPGRGTTFTLRLPLMLTITKLVICAASSATLALSVEHIEEILTPQADQTRQYGNQRFLFWQQQIIPVYRLTDLLDYRCPLPETASSKALVSVSSPRDWAAPMLVFHKDQQMFALEVDQVITEQELVIKPFSTTIASPGYTYGCTILADGSLVPVIDAIALLATVLQPITDATPESSTSASPRLAAALPTPTAPIKTAQSPTVLVVDDAATLRRSLAISLERAGLRVVQARDGQEAIDQLQQRSSIQLVICDLEMPNMNGFEFLNYRRQNPQIAKIPVAILTSRSNEKHRWLATHLGATAYFTKPYLEQEFLNAITDLIHAV
jgi:two-component system, chemotaxis family, sensor histidine kinase and response regulator PixL